MGSLRLPAFAPLAPGDFKKAGNTLTQRALRTRHSEVTVKLDLAGMADGQQAEIAHYAAAWCLLGVVQRGSVRTLTVSDGGGHATPGPTTTQNALWLRSAWGYDGQSQFSYSLDGKAFLDLGDPYPLKWGNYRGDRIGIYSFNDQGERGFVDVGWFHYAAARQ